MDAQGLQDVLIERLEVSQLGEDVQLLVVAAFEGDDELAQALEGAAGFRRRTDVPRSESSGRESAYLRSISVRAFRGVGPETSLQLQPGPGLTLVVGRNGSGKSSFAEAAEVTLTGDSYRWQGRSRIWRDGWRNLHTHEASRVAVQLAVDGQPGKTSVVRTWHGPDVGDAQCSVQRPGQPGGDLSSLGWGQDLATYRPFLSYSELGRMLDGRPSDMYDALAAILGLERLAAAEERLKRARKELADEAKRVKDELAAVKEALAASDDWRAREAEAALRGRKPDLNRAAALASGDSSSEQPAELDGLRCMSRLDGPDEEPAIAAAAELRQAVAVDASFHGTDADDARRLAELLDRALGHFQRHASEGACPVCGTADVLDHDWSVRTHAEVQRLRQVAAEADTARSRLARATEAARRLITEPPSWLPAESDVCEAWDRWWAGSKLEDASQLAQHLEERSPVLRQACEEARNAAADRLAHLEDRWQPVAVKLGAWVGRARTVEAQNATLANVKAGYDWLRSTARELRNDRLRPLAKESAEVWRELRQESNVDLGPIELAGSGTQRKVNLDVTVDGADANALGVMSQGELHALALALFLPRATMDESPFRFLVIDDPVQSMDPAKVDGLARVLSRTAGERQVVVFTHDARLADAVRRLQLPATIWEATRREDSVVELKKTGDVVDRLLEDARALLNTAQLPSVVGPRVVPGLCRQALEAALTERVRRKWLSAGTPHTDVEDAIARARGPYDLAAMAYFDDASRTGEVLTRFNNKYGQRAGDAFRRCNHAGHGPYHGDLALLVDDAAWLAERVRDDG